MRATLLLVALPWALALRQPWEYLDALKRFEAEFLDPQSVMLNGRSEVLADDIVGRVDVTTRTFEGQELNTEYLFGLFANIQAEGNTSILGFPSSQTLQTLVIQPPIVSYSAIASISYPTIEAKSIPVQIDVITAWNDDLKMISYDATFRRFPLFMDELAKHLGPVLSRELDVDYDPNNYEAIFAHKAAVDICPTAMEFCTGENQQYKSYDECYDFMTVQRPWGGALQGGHDTVLCRYVHRNMVPIRPDEHCPHVGPSGGTMCVDRDYTEVTTAFPFAQTLVAVNATWDDRDMGGLSQDSIDALARAKLTIPMPTTFAFYSVPTFATFVSLYVCSKILERALMRYSATYRLLTPTNQRNLVTYYLSTAYTSVALCYQLLALPSLQYSYSTEGIQGAIRASVIIVALYIFELIYRESMRTSMLIHHFCTLLAISSLYITLERTYHPATITVGTIWLFQATTEQSVFVGMIMYRLGYAAKRTRAVLRFAAAQSFIFKVGFAGYLMLEHTHTLLRFTEDFADVYFSIVVYTIGGMLLLTQAYGSYAVYAISTKLDRPALTLPAHGQHPSRAEEVSPLISEAGTLVDSVDSDASDGEKTTLRMSKSKNK
ncbi:hypothetical protein JCM10908_004029 [Rhodotorula pacifica]|uniref:uncharacterized protein n=1 Tax=Rhodotorula pacifica TaxID=1495444 RepID=UPI0031796213